MTRYVTREDAREKSVPKDSVVLEDQGHRIIYFRAGLIIDMHFIEVEEKCEDCNSMWVGQSMLRRRPSDIIDGVK